MNRRVSEPLKANADNPPPTCDFCRQQIPIMERFFTQGAYKWPMVFICETCVRVAEAALDYQDKAKLLKEKATVESRT